MARAAVVLNVLIASPSDVSEERDVLTSVIHEWNTVNSRGTGILLQPIRWEMHTYPASGDRPQAIIDRQIVDDADFVIGIFGYRLGTPTGEAQSGTIEEIEQLRKQGKHVALYFSTAPVPRDADREQLAALESYQQERQKDTLYSIFNTPEELRQRATRHLPSIVSEVYQRLKSSNALSEIESELKKSEARSEKRLSELANDSAHEPHGGGPEIFLHYDLPEEAKKLPGLGIKTKQLIVENTGRIDAYDVQVQDVSVHPERCRATFAIIPRLAANDKRAPAMTLKGSTGVPPYERSNLEMVLYASGDDPSVPEAQELWFSVPIVVTLRDYEGHGYRVSFTFRFDDYFQYPEIRLEGRERITGS